MGTSDKCWGVTCDGLASQSHPGRVAILLVGFVLRKQLLWATRLVKTLPLPLMDRHTVRISDIFVGFYHCLKNIILSLLLSFNFELCLYMYLLQQ